ncbi:MAG: hypothetical protein V3R33_01575 [Anaerolineales bacterium]
MSDLNTTLTCTFHPKRETQLRCNRCNRPICIKCATHTPTGYRCSECIRSQQKVFITARWFDYIITFVITGLISFLGSWLSYRMFGGIYIIFIAFGAGWLVVWTVKKAINNRRSPLLKIVMSITAFLASLYPIIFLITITNQENGYALGRGYFSLIWYLVYSVIISSNVYFQLRK